MTADKHEVEVARLRAAYAAWPQGVPVRLAKRTSNLFRFRDAAKAPDDPKAQTTVQAAAVSRLSRAAWTSPRSATCCALILPPGPRGSAA